MIFYVEHTTKADAQMISHRRCVKEGKWEIVDGRVLDTRKLSNKEFFAYGVWQRKTWWKTQWLLEECLVEKRNAWDVAEIQNASEGLE